MCAWPTESDLPRGDNESREGHDGYETTEAFEANESDEQYWSDDEDESDEEDTSDDSEKSEPFTPEQLETGNRVVAAGMAYLDEKYPDHRVRFNAGNFDIEDPFVCALAQAANKYYSDAVDETGISDTSDDWNARDNWSKNHGFLSGEYVDGVFLTSALLEHCWLKAYGIDAS